MDNFLYDVFICGSQSDLDRYVAKSIHKYISRFKLPKCFLKNGVTARRKINRIFRDQDAAPLANSLEDSTMQALVRSEFLLVICSPGLQESERCRKEIQTFIQFHGWEKVLFVLAEGELQDFFPGQNLTADVRGENKKEISKKIKKRILRIAAPMFAVPYDELHQKQTDKKTGRMVACIATAAIICLAFGVISTLAAFRINLQKKQIEEQTKETKQQIEENHDQYEEIVKQNEKLMLNQSLNLADDAMVQLQNGDRNGAIKTAKMALDEYEGIKLPHTAEAKYALTKALYVYDSVDSYKAMKQFETQGVITNLYVSDDRCTLVASDSSDCLVVWDMTTEEQIGIIEDVTDGDSDYENIWFLNDDQFVYVTHKGELCTYQISTGEITYESTDIAYPDKIVADDEGQFLALLYQKEVVVYNTADYQELYRFSAPDRKELCCDCCFADNNLFVFGYEDSLLSDVETKETAVCIVSLESGVTNAEIVIPQTDVNLFKSNGDDLYVSITSLGDLFSVNSTLYKINISSGEIDWECNLDGVYGDKLEFHGSEESNQVLYVGDMDAYTIDIDTGALTGDYHAGDIIVSTGGSGKTFVVVTSRGEYCLIDTDTEMFASMEGHIEYNIGKDIRQVVGTQAGLAILPKNENRVILFVNRDNPYMTEYDGYCKWEDEIDVSFDFVSEAAGLGLKKANLVQTILHIPEAGVMVVKYNTNRMEIIDEDSLEVLETVDDVKNGITSYLGKDSQGNLYVAGNQCGYCFDSDFQLIAEIKHLLKVDCDKNIIVVSKNTQNYEIPIYDTEQLLQIAEDEIE